MLLLIIIVIVFTHGWMIMSQDLKENIFYGYIRKRVIFTKGVLTATSL